MTLPKLLDEIEVNAKAVKGQGKWVLDNSDPNEPLIIRNEHGVGIMQFSYSQWACEHAVTMDPPTTLALVAALRESIEALELVAGPSNFNCEIGEGNQRAAAKAALAHIDELFEKEGK